MTNFKTRIADKIAKLSDSQLQTLFEALTSDNMMLSSIIESLTSGVMIVDNDWIPILSNKAVERYVPLTMHLSDGKAEGIKIFKLVKDKDISIFFKNCCEFNKTNISE